MLRPSSLKHVSFLTRDLDATLTFYGALGGKTEKNVRTPEGYRRAVISFGEGRVQFFQIPGERPAPHAHWAEHVALHVSDLGGLLERLRAQGTPITRELQTSPGGRPMAFVLDPDGRQVELLEHADL